MHSESTSNLSNSLLKQDFWIQLIYLLFSILVAFTHILVMHFLTSRSEDLAWKMQPIHYGIEDTDFIWFWLLQVNNLLIVASSSDGSLTKFLKNYFGFTLCVSFFIASLTFIMIFLGIDTLPWEVLRIPIKVCFSIHIFVSPILTLIQLGYLRFKINNF